MIKGVNSLGVNKIGITSNGLVLKRKLPQLVDAGLNAVNISLDTLNESKFEEITRRRGFNNVIASIREGVDLGIKPLKVFRLDRAYI